MSRPPPPPRPPPLTITQLKQLSHDELFARVRMVVACRLINLRLKVCASVCNVTEQAVQQILLDHGEVRRRGSSCRFDWQGFFGITKEKHAWFRFPDYIPLASDHVSFNIENGPAWMGITRDDVYSRYPDGSLRSWGDGKSTPFHREDGADWKPPEPGEDVD